MTKPIKYAALCSLSVLLAACGSDRSADVQVTSTASRVSATVATQAQPASAYHNVVQHIYVGYFGRPADAGGLAFFAQYLSNLGAPTNIVDLDAAYRSNSEVRAMIDGFGTSAESQALYPGDNNAFVDALYRNLFSRPAEADGKAYWVNAIDRGLVTRASAAVQIMAGSQTTDRDVINKKTAVAGSFTASLHSAERQASYSGLAANVVVRDLLGTVTLATDTAAFQPNIDAAFAALVRRGAQGMYAGKLTSNGRLINSLILEDGQFWTFYTADQSGTYNPGAFLQGTGSVSNGVFSSPDVKDFGSVPANPGSVTAAYFAGTTLNGDVGTPTGAVAFTAAGIDMAAYNYDAPANLAQVAGYHSVGGGVLGNHLLEIAADGTFSGASFRCAYTGKVSPRAAGTNVFDVTWTFGAGTCPLSGKTANGVAFSYLVKNGSKRNLLMAATDAERSMGSMVVSSGLEKTDVLVGTGATAVVNKEIVVHYTGWLYDPSAPNQRGAKFDSSVGGTPFTFPLGAGRVITGWDHGVPGMKVGGKRTLVIPPELGYGSRAAGAIPPNSTLIFDVELLVVK